MWRSLVLPVLVGLSLSFADDSVAEKDPVSSAGGSVKQTALASDSLREDSLPVKNLPSFDSAMGRTFSVMDAKTLPSASRRSVLYLGGGNTSPWFYLGVLYAIRDYHIPVDSVAGISWGALVGALWSAGWTLDEMQHFLTDAEVAPYFRSSGESPSQRGLGLPIAAGGISALEFRFALRGDSAGYAHFESRNIDPDTLAARKTWFRFRLAEALERGASGKYIAFGAFNCKNGMLQKSSPMGTFPFEGSDSAGDFCLASFVPKDTASFAIVPLAYPVRSGAQVDPPFISAFFALQLESLRELSSYVVIRPHTLSENAGPVQLMEIGYRSLEARLGDFSPLVSRGKDSSFVKDSILPRFKFELSLDKIPSEYYSNASAYWTSSDTGIVAPHRFLQKISQAPFYDSLDLSLDSVGSVNVNANVAPLFEFRVGGFGSNLLGASAYAAADFRYVDQFEYWFGAEGFAGANSYGIRPKLQIFGLFKNKGKFSVSGTFAKEEPLHGYFSNADEVLRVYSVRSSDMNLSIGFTDDSIGEFSVGVFLGDSRFRTSHYEEYGELKVHSLMPEFSFVRNRGRFVPWFGDKGYGVSLNAGFRSVNLPVNGETEAPLYFSSTIDLQKDFAPLDFVALGLGAAGGVNIRREEGQGYEYPETLSISTTEPEKAIDCWYRLHPALSPWSGEWPFPEASSHHYGAVRAKAGLHNDFVGAWIFGAYMRDFEDNPYVALSVNRLLLEPQIRFAYRSLDIRMGMNRLVSLSDAKDLKTLKEYNYFFKVGGDF
ncbi:MAG: hypothetical protein M0P13_04440 [Fibrobacteraceae bacterium]|nr:hypothetical protein [Fibrobacteraceae bacterium]